MTLMLATLFICALIFVGLWLLIRAGDEPERSDFLDAIEDMPVRKANQPPASAEIPDFTIGYQDGWQWAEAGHMAYICHGDWDGKDRLYWLNFHQGYRAFRRTEKTS